MDQSAVSPQIVRDFALKVATPGSRAMFLDEHNRNAGFASIADASKSQTSRRDNQARTSRTRSTV